LLYLRQEKLEKKKRIMAEQVAPFTTPEKKARDTSGDLSSLFARRLSSDRPAMNMLGDTKQGLKTTPIPVMPPAPVKEPLADEKKPVYTAPIAQPRPVVQEVTRKPAEVVKTPLRPVEDKEPISMELEELAKTVARHSKSGDAEAEDEARETAKRHLTIEAMALDTDDMEAQFEESIARFEESVEKHKQSGDPIKVRIGGGSSSEDKVAISFSEDAPSKPEPLPVSAAEQAETTPEPENPAVLYDGEPVTITGVYTNDAGEQVMAITLADASPLLVFERELEYPQPEAAEPELEPAAEELQPEVQLLLKEGEEEKLLEAEATPEPEYHKEWQPVERYKFQEISGNTFWAAKWNAAQRGNPDFILNFGVEETDTDFDIERKRQENRVILIAGGSALAVSELPQTAVNELYINDETRVLFEAVAYEVGFKVLQNLTDRQLGEYEAIVNADQSVIDAWLEQHIPDYKTSPVYQQIEAGYATDPEKNDPAKLFAGIAWLQENCPAYEEIANEVVGEFTPRFEEIEEREEGQSNTQKIETRM
tara:strand:+ start:317 stop:1927 length:1611 start_codon:yes stop_codon:yes gene_type:complete